MPRYTAVRLAGFLTLLVSTVMVFVAAGLVTWHKRDFWETQLRQVQVESIQFAQEYRAAFHELNVVLLRYRLGGDSAERDRFRQAADELSRRIAQLNADAFIPESLEILAQLTVEFARYRERAEAVFSHPASLSPGELIAQLEAASGRVLARDARLSAMQREVLASFVTRVRLDMDQLWDVLYAAMATMLISGGVLGWIAYRDLIAPLRRTVVRSQQLLEQREKLDSLGLLTAGLAHEIRNPLNSIKARLFTQRRVLGEGSAGLEDNRFIEEEVDRLEGIVSSALQFARPAEPAFQRLRLQSAIEPWCGLLESSLRQSEIELRSDFRANPEVTADLNQVKQALLNLINNAAESIGRKGTITLRTIPTLLRLGGRRKPAIALEVQDTGPGVSPEVRKRLFDPFYTTKQNGTGLGLSIAARIAHAHGGVIEHDSVPGRGATFSIVLPAV